jgi:hypothetical protein
VIALEVIPAPDDDAGELQTRLLRRDSKSKNEVIMKLKGLEVARSSRLNLRIAPVLIHVDIHLLHATLPPPHVTIK